MEHTASPVILMDVRPISTKRSTPKINPMPSKGKPMDYNTKDNIKTPAPGTPAVPIEAKVAVKTTINI